jgi:hypothetical protein
MLNFSVGLSENIGALKTKLIGLLTSLLLKMLPASAPSIALEILLSSDASLSMLSTENRLTNVVSDKK